MLRCALPLLAVSLVACHADKVDDTATATSTGTDSGGDTHTGATTDDTHTGTPTDDTGTPTDDTGTPTDDTGTDDTASADADGDGFGADVDCNDADPAVNPGATEVCNGVDDDCDGLTDDSDDSLDATTTSSWYPDSDGDGYGGGESTDRCDAPSGGIADGSDCDDSDPAVNPGASEVCNALDDDCDLLIDDADDSLDTSTASTWYSDSDGDGYGDAADPGTGYCDAPVDVVADASDCDDSSAAAHPGGTEVCDNLDNDCDGAVDWGTRVPTDQPTIQSGIDAAATGDTVCVEAGTYTETLNFGGRAITVEGTDGSAATTIDGGGTGPVVTFASAEAATTVLTGFTISGGTGAAGAGVYISSASPTLRDLIITGNSCDAPDCYGTGLYAEYGSPVIDGSVITANDALGSATIVGAGAYFGYTNVTATDSQFDGNTASSDGSVYGTGLAVVDDNGGVPSFTNVTVDDNVTTLTNASTGNQYGSAYVYNTAGTFEGVSVSGNEGYDGYNVWAAGVCENYSSSTWTNVTVSGNLADTYYVDAAGMRLMYSNSSWTNAIVAGNAAIATYIALSSGVFVDRSSAAVFTNVDVASNSVDGAGSATVWTSGFGEYANGSTVTLVNVGIAGNTVTSTAATYGGGVFSNGNISATYGNVYGNDTADWYGVTDPVGTNGNISADPLYTDTSAADPRDWDLHLLSGSSLIDAGDPAIFDVDGTRSDVGGYGGPNGSWP